MILPIAIRGYLSACWPVSLCLLVPLFVCLHLYHCEPWSIYRS